MIRALVHDPAFLAEKSETATAADFAAAQDLLDTLIAHKENCVGMAANMIGIRRCIIAFQDISSYTVMLNPEIITSSGPYETEEGCLSLLGGPRSCRRFRTVKVRYLDMNLNECEKIYRGFPAQIIQHEIDHCNGVLI